MTRAQSLFSITLITLLAVAGLYKGVDVAWKLAIATAALAFFSEGLRWRAQYELWAYRVGNGLALLSWFTGAAAGVSLLIYA